MRVGAFFALIATMGCSGQPAPSVGQLDPNVVCGSGTLPLSLSGKNFLARAVGTLAGETALEVPSVQLTPSSGSTVYPDVSWVSTQLVMLEVPLGQLSPGSYTLSLTDPDGQTTSAANALNDIAVAPVTISAIAPANVCIADADQQVVVTGTGFDPAAQVSLRGGAGGNVMVSITANSATSLTVTLPMMSFGPGNYALVVENPPEAGCQATAAQPMVIDPPPKLTAVTGNVCSDGGRLMVTGTGLLAGATVELSDGPSPLPATQVSVMSSTAASVTFPANLLPRNSRGTLVWQNPDGCATMLADIVHVKPGQGGCN